MLRIIGRMIRRRRPRAQTKNGRMGAVEYDLVRCEYPSAVRRLFDVRGGDDLCAGFHGGRNDMSVPRVVLTITTFTSCRG